MAGRSWRRCSVPDDTGTVTALALSPRFQEDGTALAATLDNGILRSTDSGQSWQTSSFGLQSLEVAGPCLGNGRNRHCRDVVWSLSFTERGPGVAGSCADGRNGVRGARDDRQTVRCWPRRRLAHCCGRRRTSRNWSPARGTCRTTSARSAMLSLRRRPDRCWAPRSTGSCFRPMTDAILVGGIDARPRSASRPTRRGSIAGTATGVMQSAGRRRDMDGSPAGAAARSAPAAPVVDGLPLVSGSNSPPVIDDPAVAGRSSPRRCH